MRIIESQWMPGAMTTDDDVTPIFADLPKGGRRSALQATYSFYSRVVVRDAKTDEDRIMILAKVIMQMGRDIVGDVQ